jgi:outer membrane protein W
MRNRILMLLVALALPASLFAQSNAFAVFVNHGTFNSTSAADPSGITLEIKFDSKLGYGASFDHYLSPNLSAQFLAQRLRADAKVVVSGGGTSVSQNAGTLDLNEYDAALHWHFGTGKIKPYAGLGVAAIHGAKIHVPADATDSGVAEDFSLDNKFTWVADAGIDFRVSPNASVIVTAKYTPYSSGVGADPGDPIQRLKLDPLTYAAGVQWRF